MACTSHPQKKWKFKKKRYGKYFEMSCHGYHTYLTTRNHNKSSSTPSLKQAVLRIPCGAAPCPFFSFGFGLLQSLNHSAAEPSLGGCGFSWCSGYHVCFTRTRSPVRSRARTFLIWLDKNLMRKRMRLTKTTKHAPAPAWSSG